MNNNVLAILTGFLAGGATILGMLYYLAWIAGQNPEKYRKPPPLSPADPVLDEVASTLTTTPKIVNDKVRQHRARPRPHRDRTRK